MTSYKLSLQTSPDSFPFAALVLASYLGNAIGVSFDFEGEDGKPCILTRTSDATAIDEAETVVRTLAKAAGMESNSTRGEAMSALARTLPTSEDFAALVGTLDSLDDRLALRTFLDGHELTVVDWLVWGAIKGSLKPLGIMKRGKHVHLLRWFTYIETLPTTEAALAELAAARSREKGKDKTAASFGLGLKDAKEGQVVTRFPPEPSGFLHIGHLKAAILNEYFASFYKGKLIIRFDDTNPSNEKDEFEQSILDDLAVLNIVGDKVTHTSDHFDMLYDYALKMIKTGKAYVDDSPQSQMKHERENKLASPNRDLSVEENLKRFQWMKDGTDGGLKCCLRAKINFSDNNGAMRDPVIYRCNVTSHHRTGDKWKIYPTYDFACPIVDAYEGVTHALRTNEYRDRNPQYEWMLQALGLRKVNIWDFSRISFVHTFLSKRKLRKCIEMGLARGWDDPRFPTFKGIRRRGMTTEALRQFMLSQGPSQNQVTLEWDSIWTLNKKIIDPIAPRFVAIATDKMVTVKVQGAPTSPETQTKPLHKKNPEVGQKQTVYLDTILLEQEDALSFADNEEITLMDWGNAIVRSATKTAEGVITDITMDLHLAGDFKATEKKITWLAKPSAAYPLVPVTLLDYDYLITKPKLEEDDELEDVANRNTEFSAEALADANVLKLKKGDIIQFERKGYYILDEIVEKNAQGERAMKFIHIPDGRASGLALKATVPEPVGKKEKGKKSAGAQTSAEECIKMYKVDPVNSSANIELPTSMYKVKRVDDSSA